MHGVLGAVYNVVVGKTAEGRSGRASMATMPKSALQHGVVRCRKKREGRCREDDGGTGANMGSNTVELASNEGRLTLFVAGWTM